jgi:hypothetical protein
MKKKLLLRVPPMRSVACQGVVQDKNETAGREENTGGRAIEDDDSEAGASLQEQVIEEGISDEGELPEAGGGAIDDEDNMSWDEREGIAGVRGSDVEDNTGENTTMDGTAMDRTTLETAIHKGASSSRLVLI